MQEIANVLEQALPFILDFHLCSHSAVDPRVIFAQPELLRSLLQRFGGLTFSDTTWPNVYKGMTLTVLLGPTNTQSPDFGEESV